MGIAELHAEMNEAVLLYEGGETSEAVGARYGVSSTTVLVHLRRRGVKIRARGENILGTSRRSIPVTRYGEVAQRYRNGETTPELAKVYGVTRATIRKILIRIGEPRRPVGERKQRLRRHKNWHGYITVWLPKNAEFASMRKANGHVAEHRLVMAQHLGRPLHPGESVHHVNGVRDDNRLENLQLRHRWHGYGQAMCCADCGSRNIVADELEGNAPLAA